MNNPLVKNPREYRYEAKIFIQEPHIRQMYTERFWGRVDIRGPRECWNWKEHKKPNGYGLFQMCIPRGTGIPTSAHRLAWTMHYNTPIPDNLWICHSCDNKLCCNPAHLFLATPAVNTQDSILKGRFKPWGYDIHTSSRKEKRVSFKGGPKKKDKSAREEQSHHQIQIPNTL
jgi:hypothetical protein